MRSEEVQRLQKLAKNKMILAKMHVSEICLGTSETRIM